MRQTSDDILTRIYRYVKATELAETISGEVIKGKDRKANSRTEDIVIKILANHLAQRQEAYVNVNIYVPDVESDGHFEKNDTRCNELERLSMDLLEVFWVGTARVTCEEQQTYPVANGREHVINNKLLFTIENSNRNGKRDN